MGSLEEQRTIFHGQGLPLLSLFENIIANEFPHKSLGSTLHNAWHLAMREWLFSLRR